MSDGDAVVRGRSLSNFVNQERAAQSAFFSSRLPPGTAGHGGAPYRLLPQHAALNLEPSIREPARAYFHANQIVWHRHANHGLSSQVSCINALMPLATRPELLAKMIEQALGLQSVTMREVDRGPDGSPWFVGFEWIGRADYLNESGRSGSRTRGANATSADAIVRLQHAGRTETLLIEWKYTESYGTPIPPKGNGVRAARYSDRLFAPRGPIRPIADLAIADFFWEPFYQLLRQQMLAFQMQAAREDGADRVRVLHLSPRANTRLHAVTAPAMRRYGEDAFCVFRSLLTEPDDFVSLSTEEFFGATLSNLSAPDRSWADYLLERYSFLRAQPAFARDNLC